MIVAVVCFSSGLIAASCQRTRPLPSDFSYVWDAARLLSRGSNPWEMIGPGRAIVRDTRLYYPVQALLVATPLSFLPLWWANIIFAVTSSGLCAWAVTRNSGSSALLLFASLAFVVTLDTVQWSPLLIAAALTPSLGWLLACKPTIGAALLCAYPSKRGIVGAVFFGLACVVVWPWWVPDWLAAAGTGTHITAPLMRRGGPLLLLALLDWRTAEGRLLAALACVPQTPVLYESLPPFLTTKYWWEAAALAIATFVVGYFGSLHLADMDYAQWMRYEGNLIMWTMYLPALAMLLFRKGRTVCRQRASAAIDQGIVQVTP